MKRIFYTALCASLLMQSTALVNAEETPVPSGKDDNIIYPEDEFVDVREEELEVNPGTHDEINLLIDDGSIGDEGSDALGIKVTYHSRESIRKYFNELAATFMDTEYAQTPSVTVPYSPGALTDETLEEAVKAVNLIRYIAGLNSNITLNDTYTEMLQAGSLINAINNQLSHDPEQPAGMDDALYNLGKSGNQSANIAMGYASLAKAVTQGWLSDGDDSNIERVGHRRWLLNAKMGQTGFGQVGEYSGMYAFDTSNSTSVKTSNVWPAQNTPIEFFGTEYPWSISTGNTEDISKVKVKMTDRKTGTDYEFSADSSYGYFNVSNTNNGVKGAVIWRPENFTYEDGDSYTVSITGLTTGDVQYTVSFFQLIGDPEIFFTPSEVTMSIGDSVKVKYGITPATADDSVKGVGKKGSFFSAAVVENEANTYLLKAVRSGEGYLRAYSEKGLETYLPVIVKGIGLNAYTYSLVANGKGVQLKATIYPQDTSQTYTWTSSDPSVASVTSDGAVYGHKAGTATITASGGGYSASCVVTVTAPAATGVSVSPATVSLKPGKTAQLTATVTPTGADQTVTWASSNTNAATVDSNGLVTGVAEGTATITATTGSYTATCTVTVTDPITVESVSLSLKEKIEANFYVYVPDKELATTDINIAFNGTITTKHAADITPKTFNGKACRVVSVATLAKQMRDEITVTVTKKDATEKKYLEYKDADVTNGMVFKIEDYVKLVEANSTNAKLIDLVHKMDNYGKYAQTQFKYNLDSFDAAESIPSDYKDSRLTPYLVNNSGSVTGLAYASGSLELESDTGLRVYYNLTGTDAISTYTFTVDGKKVTPTKKGTQYYVSIKNIPARLMSKSHTIVVKDKAGKTLTTTYSGLSYPAAVVASSAAPDSLKNLCRSIDLYAEAALTYFGE